MSTKIFLPLIIIMLSLFLLGIGIFFIVPRQNSLEGDHSLEEIEEKEGEERESLWSLEKVISNFPARVLKVDSNIINVVVKNPLFKKADNNLWQKKYVEIIIRGETDLFKSKVDESEGFIKRTLEDANLKDILPEMEINVYSSNNILEDRVINASQIEIKDGIDHSRWLSVFEGWISEIIDDNNFYVNFLIGDSSHNEEICNSKTVLIQITENTEMMIESENLEVDMGLHIFADDNVLEEQMVNALKIEIISDFVIPPVCNIRLQQGDFLDWPDIDH